MNSTPQHLSIFHPSMEVGGAERIIVHLANGFADRGHNVDLLLKEKTGRLIEQIDSSVEVIELSAPAVPGIGLTSSIPALAQYLQQRDPQSLYTAGNHVNIVAILAHYVSGSETKMIISEHKSPLPMGNANQAFGTALKNKILHRSEKYLYPRADTIIAVSQGTKRDLAEVAQIPQEDIHLIYNPVVTPELCKKAKQTLDHPYLGSGSPPAILSVGSLSPRKDYSTLIRAFSRIIENRDARLILVGRDGGERAKLENLIQSLGLQEVATIEGYVENPYAYMANANVFVLSSQWEGFGNVLVEAMACGCPVVSTDCPRGPSEILEGGRYGPLPPVGDPKLLAQAIDATLDGPPDPEFLKSRAESFSVDRALDRYSEILL